MKNMARKIMIYSFRVRLNTAPIFVHVATFD